MNKRADISMGTIVVLVIALIVLVTVVLFFTGGYKNLVGIFSGFSKGALTGAQDAGNKTGDLIKSGVW